MKAHVQVLARRQGRIAGFSSPPRTITDQTIDAPDDMTSRQLAISVAISQIKRALSDLGGIERDDYDTVEFLVDFEEE